MSPTAPRNFCETIFAPPKTTTDQDEDRGDKKKKKNLSDLVVSVTLTNTPIFAFPYSCYTTTFVNNLDTNFDFDRQHGVKRSKDGSSQPKPMSVEEDAQLTEYKRLNQDLLERHALKRYSEPDSLSLSTMVLRINPEHVTAWSFRRHCLLTLRPRGDPDQEGQAFDGALQGELPLTLASFQRNPKAYPIWEHRKWALAQILLEKMFKLDGRNFHAWDYRRHVISKIKHSQPSERLDADELAFSGQQIEANFSNFSAWHYRSNSYDPNWTNTTIFGLNLKMMMDRVEKDKILKTELEWVRGALWIDPNDQSAWLYHRWLLSQSSYPQKKTFQGRGSDLLYTPFDFPRDEQIQTDEYASIAELLEVEPDAKWAIAALILARPVEYAHLLDRLIALDPLRKQRYLDLVRPQSPS
ncbi:hypothetical protein PSHT_10575 [Puccinia striiformis]|uniref:Geranylgeranyl transferase type-2 subunit alpha n=1 Tax=Puccinia striiformis TaxID=27350 RepID=A0A2S4V8N9_9BASI|nr:hypothetical protein PSHT_10575 [Puccinia striiformis]